MFIHPPRQPPLNPPRGPCSDDRVPEKEGTPVVTPKFDEEIHAPVRLRICGILAAVKAVDFATIRDTLGLADSVVSKHVSRLEATGYVLVEKISDGGRPHTWISLTPQGRTAFTAHIAALQQIASNAGVLQP